MTKAYVDELIRNMKMAGIVAKATPWSYEGFGDKQKNVRYVGLKLVDDWLEIFSDKDNLLLKFVTDRSSAFVEYYLANNTPFVRFYSERFREQRKWEILLGELKRKLKKDKSDALHHKDVVGNLYKLIEPNLK